MEYCVLFWGVMWLLPWQVALKSGWEGGIGLAIETPMVFGKEQCISACLDLCNASNIILYKNHGDEAETLLRAITRNL